MQTVLIVVATDLACSIEKYKLANLQMDKMYSIRAGLLKLTTPFMIASFLMTPYKYKRKMNEYFLTIYLLGSKIHIHIDMKMHSFRTSNDFFRPYFFKR